jgi:hypothetical protein
LNSQFGGNPEHQQLLAEWLIERDVEEVVIESTAQYWKPVWGHWNGSGNRDAKREKLRDRCRERYIWHKPSTAAVIATVHGCRPS